MRVIKSILFCCTLMLDGIALAQSQDKEWKDFKVQSEPKKLPTSLDRTATSSNPYQFESYHNIRREVTGQVKSCVINNNGYVVLCN